MYIVSSADNFHSPGIRALDGVPRVEFSASKYAKEKTEEMCG
jgi:hypothetical protein